ncbi:MAG: hypothetical protein P8166_06345 [Candidatus Thiodiazotropha sp.]
MPVPDSDWLRRQDSSPPPGPSNLPRVVAAGTRLSVALGSTVNLYSSSA